MRDIVDYDIHIAMIWTYYVPQFPSEPDSSPSCGLLELAEYNEVTFQHDYIVDYSCTYKGPSFICEKENALQAASP